ncbi:MAG: RND transporter [Gammaproteobacteria bacterium]|nr:RND transporter [Gammaproteobacteria bacterium]
MLSFVDKIPWVILIVGSLVMGMLPYPMEPMPHLLEKLLMLVNGTLTKPVDIFDLVFHAALPMLLLLRLLRRIN